MSTPLIYHIMIDRFAGCDSKREGRRFKGGTLKGILGKLDYLQQLGCTSIMLTPFYKTAQYHGYHIVDYTQVDEHFGSWVDVDNLVAEVHRRGMTITADFVANHCHHTNQLVKEHPDWFKRDKEGQMACFEGISELPEFNLDHPDACQYMIERAKELCLRGFDSIRLDYAKGPSLKFWKRFRAELKKEHPNVVLVGEVWGAPKGKRLPSELSKAVREKRLSRQEAWQMRYSTVFDAVLDFVYHSLLCEAVHKRQSLIDNKTFQRKLVRHFGHYDSKSDSQLWLFLDNHDTNRFLFECRGNVDKLKDAIKLTMAQNRPYLFYYGTEKGMTHPKDRFATHPYGDEQVRECMKWKNEQIIQTIKEL